MKKNIQMIANVGICALLLAAYTMPSLFAQTTATTATTEIVQNAAKTKGSIEGSVVSAGTQDAIAGVKVELVGAKLGAITNAAGKFVVKHHPLKLGGLSLNVSSGVYPRPRP
jgi:hypothetical protein